jgi:ABC-2 type transport system permease protein
MNSALAPAADHTRSAGAANLGGLATLYALTLRQYLHGKRWLVTAGLFLLPAGLALLIRSTANEQQPLMLEFLLAWMFVPQLLLPLTALLYASGMVQDEQEEQTITYLLVRPLPKWAIYVVKLLATLTLTVALTAVFTALTYAVIYVGAPPPPGGAVARCLKAAAIHSLGVVAYCSLFGVLSLLTKRTLVIGFAYAVVIEGLLANLPFSIRLLTVIYYTRLIAYRVLPFVIELPGGDRIENMSGEAWQLHVEDDPQLLAHPQLGTCIAVLLIASVACTIVAAWICSRREFHVKTPEKA